MFRIYQMVIIKIRLFLIVKTFTQVAKLLIKLSYHPNIKTLHNSLKTNSVRNDNDFLNINSLL